MADLIIYFLLSLGVPLPEFVGRPAAERLEMIDVREGWQWVDWPARCKECATLPPLWECNLLPPVEVCFEHARFAANHLCWVERMAETNVDQAWKEWRREAQAISLFWANARDSKMSVYCVIIRRRDLARARVMVEPWEWYAGRMPDFAPLWRFADMPTR